VICNFSRFSTVTPLNLNVFAAGVAGAGELLLGCTSMLA
jgi:hypothetical protein